MIRYKQQPKVGKAKILRSVASSTAIETGKSVKAIEAKLKTQKAGHQEVQLAF